MSIARSLLPFVLYLYSFSLAAQADHWDAYIARQAKGISSTTLNLALKDEAPVRGLPFVVVTGVYFRDCMKDGLPTPTEFIRLGMINDSVQSWIGQASRRNIPAGTFTYQCSSAGYTYVTDTLHIRPLLQYKFARVFPGYVTTIRIEADSSWNAYLHFLYPNEEVREYMANQKSVIALQRAGDRPDKPRTTTHWLYFSSKGGADCFLKFAKLKQFRFGAAESTGETERPWKVTIRRVDKVDLESISKLTTELRSKAKSCGGSYGGWETTVVN